MIPNHDPDLLASIGEPHLLPVRAFDDHGNAMILDRDHGVLRPANTHPGFATIHIRAWDPHD